MIMIALARPMLIAVPLLVSAGVAQAQVPEQIALPGAAVVAAIHAEGAQVYECKPAANGLVWTFREPVATLILDGKTVGRHYAGPTWEHADGSAIMAKAAGSAPGASPKDIPWLKLQVTDQRGTGTLAGVKFVQRINTQGGTASEACEKGGALLSVPYSADYLFLR